MMMATTPTTFARVFLISIVVLTLSLKNNIYFVRGACQSCLHAPLYRRIHQHQHHGVVVHSAAIATSLQRRSGSSLRTTFPFLGLLTIKSLQQRSAIVAPIAFAVGVTVAQRYVMGRALRADSANKKETADDADEAAGGDQEEEADKPVVTSAMVATIGVYKNFISPLLPPACRFLPTCSQYGVQAIEQFGPTKGCILTAWRLMRCSPFGGKGYDPPKWPPVAYTYSSNF